MGLFNRKKNNTDEVHGDIKTPALPIKARNKNSDDHLYSQIISYSDHTGLIILISYSEEYFLDMIEFISAATISNIQIASVHSTYEEPTDRTDKYGETITIPHDRYYVLMGGHDKAFANIFNNISNISNRVLECITQDLYEVADRDYFEELIANGVLEDTFARNTGVYLLDSLCLSSEDNSTTFYLPNIKEVIKKIPNAFNIYDITSILLFNKHRNNASLDNEPTPLYTILRGKYTLPYTKDKHYNSLFQMVVNHNITNEDINFLTGPRYLYDADEEDDGLSDQEVDDIFKAKYERFSAVADSNIKYESIDEELE